MENFKFVFTFPDCQEAIRMIESQPCTEEASRSAVISMADYLISNFPLLVPPFSFDAEWPKPQVTQNSPWEDNIYHPYYEIWNDVIIDRVIKNFAIRNEDTLYVDIQLRKEDYEGIKVPQNFEVIDINFETTSPKDKLQKIFGLPTVEYTSAKIALLSTHQYSRYGYPFSMRICKDGLLIGALFNNQQWEIIYFDKGEVPTPQDFAAYQAVILPGSSDSVLNWTPLRQQYLINLDKAMDLSPDLKVLGICYGFQAICMYYGSKVIKKERKGGIEKVQLNHSLREKYEYLRQLPEIEPLLISQHHEDYVTDIPEGFQLLGKSDSCLVQCVVGRKGRILAFQGHTEYFPKYTQLYQKRYSNYYKNSSLLTNFYLPSTPLTEKTCMMHSLQVYNCFSAFIRQKTS